MGGQVPPEHREGGMEEEARVTTDPRGGGGATPSGRQLPPISTHMYG